MGEVDAYIAALDGDARDWMRFFVDHMRAEHPDLEELLYYGVPTFRYPVGKRKGYVAFSTAQSFFTMHTLDFDFIPVLRTRLSKPGKGKGCVNVPYKSPEEREVITQAVNEVLARTRT